MEKHHNKNDSNKYHLSTKNILEGIISGLVSSLVSGIILYLILK